MWERFKSNKLADIISEEMVKVDNEYRSRCGGNPSLLETLKHPDLLIKGAFLLPGLIFLAPPDAAIRATIKAIDQVKELIQERENISISIKRKD